MRLVHSLAKLGQSIADIRESMSFTAQSVLQVLFGQRMELIQNAVHALFIDGVKLVGRSCNRRKTNLVKPEVLFQVPENLDDIRHAGG